MISFNTCRARWESGLLTLGNSLFTECWRLENGRLRLVSFRRAQGSEWVVANEEPAPGADGWAVEFSAAPGQAEPCEQTALLVELRLSAAGESTYYRFRIFEDVPGVLMSVTSSSPEVLTGAVSDAPAADGVETATDAVVGDAAGPLLPFRLKSPHLRVRSVEFIDQTDHHSNFVTEREWLMHPSERRLSLKTNLALVEDPADGEGFAWVLLAPLRHVRKAWSPAADFLFVYRDGALTATPLIGGCTLARLAWRGGRAEATAALHALQRALHAWDPERDGLLLSNTWGDRKGASRLGESFLLEEIAAARRLGTEVVQIDDGWQKGDTVNTVSDRKAGGVWNGFWAADADFWEPHPMRFPRGLEPVVAAARAAGVRLGLWFAPDSSDDLANWRKDADRLLELWERYGVAHFKLDAIKLNSPLAEERFHALCREVQLKSGGRVLFDFDATAEQRVSYWGRPQGNALFLENRYTDWRSYHPHQTLRGLWTLSSWVLPSRLRLEFLNPERNETLYGDDPLRPAAYPPNYLFAITMAASPLAWFESSSLSAALVERWAPLIARWKEHRGAFHRGQVLPVGAAPDGYSWTGFVSFDEAEGTLYALIFRELHPEPGVEITLFLPLPTFGKAQRIAGEGDAFIRGNILQVNMPSSRHFLFMRWTSDYK